MGSNDHQWLALPPNVPMITGITPTRATKRSVEDTVVNTVSAVFKAMANHSPQATPRSSLLSTPGVAVSLSKAVDIRGKYLTQLANLFEDSVLTEKV